MEYAVQWKYNGDMIDIFPNLKSANDFISKLNNPNDFYTVNVEDNIKLEMRYYEPSTRNNYGCICPEYITYGNPYDIARGLSVFIQNIINHFVRDKDYKNYLAHCSIYINNTYYAKWESILTDILCKHYIECISE